LPVSKIEVESIHENSIHEVTDGKLL
jgi:hypothetical protein